MAKNLQVMKTKMKKKAPVKNKPKHPGGRPTDYTPDVGKEICQIVQTHPYGLEKLCQDFDIFPEDRSTIYDWMHKYPEFSHNYMTAKSKQVNNYVDYCIDLTDQAIKKIELKGEISASEVMALRLAVDTRKWYASKLAPKIYGDRTIIQNENTDEEKLKKEKKELRSKLDKKNKRDY